MSWALRSFLSRQHNLLSRVRPVRRGARHPINILGSSNLIDSRGHASNSSGDLHAEVKRHLYVVLDDHEDCYGIHKLDLGDDHDDLGGGGARRLPEPPFLRVALSTVTERVLFAAVGSSIVAIGGSLNIRCWNDYCDVRLFFVYHTERAAMEVTHHLPIGLGWQGIGFGGEGHKVAVAIGGRMYMLESAPVPVWNSYQRNGGGNVHRPTPYSVVNGGEWSSWEPLSYYSRWSWSWSQPHWGNPLTPRFWVDHITAYAAQVPAQNELEIVVSVRSTFDWEDNRLGAGTFSFNTASREWTRRGDWQMPVHGQAYYDGGLDAWLGLHAVHDGGDMDRPRVTDGRLCAGQITAAPTEWKVSGEKLFRLEEDVAAGWRHLDAKFVPMAPREGGGEYCLVERLLPSKGDEECLGDGDDKNAGLGNQYEWLAKEKECLLRLTAFRVERGHDGEPVATARRPARSYRVSRYNTYFDAQAFWM